MCERCVMEEKMFLVNYPEVKEEGALPVFVRGIGIGYTQDSVARPSLVYPQILYSVKGTGVITVDGNTVEIPEKTGFFLNKGVEYHYAPKGCDRRRRFASSPFAHLGLSRRFARLAS